ncbi:hypothetical protein F511_42516 [Dorcoceras hygrometricum]|uniref:Uncharacterized protein n=1 Tax=Dorcoceras hygrometricum TaxID=472368 RepID=A0A2Z7BAZ9_9LAMI|nr:hypothetical protein F511_42516 [Dorcoceras hygrometricum]
MMTFQDHAVRADLVVLPMSGFDLMEFGAVIDFQRRTMTIRLPRQKAFLFEAARRSRKPKFISFLQARKLVELGGQAFLVSVTASGGSTCWGSGSAPRMFSVLPRWHLCLAPTGISRTRRFSVDCGSYANPAGTNSGEVAATAAAHGGGGGGERREKSTVASEETISGAF